MDAKHQATDPKEEIKKKTLQIAGICTRMQYKQFTMTRGLQQITTISNEIDNQVNQIGNAHLADKQQQQAKNRELAKAINGLRKQLTTTQQELRKTKQDLEDAKADLDTSRASLEAIFDFSDEEEADNNQQQ